MTNNHAKSRGLTLLELMITLAVAGILIASSAPSFTASIRNTRLVTQVNELQASLSMARSEAVKRNENVTVCRSSDSASCTGAWQDGWIVFLDIDGDGSVDGGDGDEVLRVHDSLSGDNSLTFSLANIVYGANGIASSGVNGVFTLCDVRGTAHVKGLVIGLSGRPRLAIDSDNLACAS